MKKNTKTTILLTVIFILIASISGTIAYNSHQEKKRLKRRESIKNWVTETLERNADGDVKVSRLVILSSLRNSPKVIRVSYFLVPTEDILKDIEYFVEADVEFADGRGIIIPRRINTQQR